MHDRLLIDSPEICRTLEKEASYVQGGALHPAAGVLLLQSL